MLQINPNVTSAYGSHRAKFGQRESEISRITQILTEENNTGKSDDEFKAEKLEKLADAIRENNHTPSALKSFAIVGALGLASGLTASAVSGRLYSFLNQATPLFGKVGRKVLTSIAKAQQELSQHVSKKQKGVKAVLINSGNKALIWLQDLGKNGIKKELSEIAHKDAKELAALKKQIKSAAEKKGIKLTVKDVNAEVKKIIQKEQEEAIGANLMKKGTKTLVGGTTAFGTFKEAATDENHDGIPDVVQKKDAHKKATEQVTAALIDCALDSCGI